jgi:sugar phosphate isomerase/epimerase
MTTYKTWFDRHRTGGTAVPNIGINLADSFLDGRLAALEEGLSLAADLGYDSVELSAYGLNVVVNGRCNRDRVAAIHEILRHYPLAYTVHGPCELNLALDASDGIAESALAAYLNFCAEIEADIFVYHSGLIHLHAPYWGLAPLPLEDTIQTRHEYEVAALQRLAPRADDLGVIIAMENRDPHLWEVAALARQGRTVQALSTYHPGLLMDKVLTQIEAVDHPAVGLTLDVGHAYIASQVCGFDYLAAVEAAAPHVKHIHFHDNCGKLDGFSSEQAERLPFGQGDLHMPPGWGEIPLQETLRLLKTYEGTITLEIRPRYHDHLEASLARTRDLWQNRSR